MTAQAAEKKTVKSKKEKALVIVESPAKSKTIKKILGDGYQIEASFGHVRNLPDNVLGFDVNNDFKPTYVVIPEKKKVVTKLNDLAKRSDKIYLASDPAHVHISSSAVRMLMASGADISGLVPDQICKIIAERVRSDEQ